MLALAVTGGSPSANNTGKVNKVPPPTTALQAPAKKPTPASKAMSNKLNKMTPLPREVSMARGTRGSIQFAGRGGGSDSATLLCAATAAA